MKHSYAWCTYREWSFNVLDGLLDLPDWRCGLIVTTHDCRSNLSRFERVGISVLRINPAQDLKAGGAGYLGLCALQPQAIFHYGWSWLVPPPVLDLCPNVTLHPGKLPKDRGGSPIQNQIRNGEDSSYANIIQLVPGLDEGPVYDRETFSLQGEDVDAVWARMISAGIVASRRFLGSLAAGTAKAVPQDPTVEPIVYRRVTPEQAQLSPDSQTARQMYDIVRAHNETDCNTYVVFAWVLQGDKKITIDRAHLTPPNDTRIVHAGDPALETDPYELAHAINQGLACLAIPGRDGKLLFISRVRMAPAEPLIQV